MRRVALALVHHPVVDAESAVVTTAVTNLDVHDLARSGRTYGCSDLFVVHPIEAQRTLVERIRHHWTEGSSAKRIPDRKGAISIVRVVSALDDAIDALGGRANVEVWITAARQVAPPTSFADARARLAGDGPPVLIVFGTGWGLAQSVIAAADLTLEPIHAGHDTGFNHLSVRAACAIALDRLRGPK
ncbi:MAG: RNA methyltransferase [Polyangiaceae bacterium]